MHGSFGLSVHSVAKWDGVTDDCHFTELQIKDK